MTVVINTSSSVTANRKTGGTVNMTGAGSLSFTGQTSGTAAMTGGSTIGGEVNGLIPSTQNNVQTFGGTVLNLTTASTLTEPAVGFSSDSSGNVVLGEGPTTGLVEFIAGGLSFARDNTAANNANIIIVAPFSTTVTVPAGMNAYLFVGPPGSRVFDRLIGPGVTTLTESDFSVGTQITVVGLGAGMSQVLDSFIAGMNYVLVPVAFTIPITAQVSDDAIVDVMVTAQGRFVAVMNNSESVNPRLDIAASAWPAAAIHEKVIGEVLKQNSSGNTFQQALADWIANKTEIVTGNNINLYQIVGGTLVQYDEARWDIDADVSNDRTLGYILAVEADGTQLSDNAVLARPADVDTRLNVFPLPTSTSASAIVELQRAGLKEELNTRKVTQGTLRNAQLILPRFGADQ